MSPGVGASISLTGFELQCRSSPSYFWNKITHAKTQRGQLSIQLNGSSKTLIDLSQDYTVSQIMIDMCSSSSTAWESDSEIKVSDFCLWTGFWSSSSNSSEDDSWTKSINIKSATLSQKGTWNQSSEGAKFQTHLFSIFASNHGNQFLAGGLKPFK